jgi:septation ring formation regulator EzrA
MGEETQQILKEFGDNIEKLQEACEEYAVSTNYTNLRGFLIELRDKLQVIKTRKEAYEQELQKIDLKNNEDALEEFNKKIKKYYDTIVSELKDFDIVMLEINELNFYNASFGFLDYLLENGDKF